MSSLGHLENYNGLEMESVLFFSDIQLKISAFDIMN
jgi:hypothetical protein